MSLNGLREDRATLSGVASETTLVLPPTINAISVGGDFGSAGMVLGKNNLTNVLYWDTVTGATIPPNSITGSQLRSDITFSTTGEIEAKKLKFYESLTGTANKGGAIKFLVDSLNGDTTTDGTLNLTTTQTNCIDITGSGIIQGNQTTETICKNLDLSDTSNIVPQDAKHEDIIFYKSLTGTNTDGGATTFLVNSQGSFTDTRLTMNGDLLIADSLGVDMFKVLGQTGFTEIQGSLDVYGRIRPRKSDEGIKFMNTGKLLGYSVSNTICENLDLSDLSNIFPTDAKHEDIIFYKSLTGTNGIAGQTTILMDSTKGDIQLNRDDVGNTLAYRNIEGHITGIENGGTTTYSLTASNGNFTCSDIDFIGGLNGRAVIGLESVATSINLLDATNIIGNPEVIVIADATDPPIYDAQTFQTLASPVWGDLVASNRLNLSFRARELKQSFSCSFFYDYMNTGAAVLIQLFFRLYDVTAGAGITETERTFEWISITSPPTRISKQITINGYLDNYYSLLATKVLKPQVLCYAPSGTGHTFSVNYGGNIGIGNGVAFPHAEFRIKDMPPSTKTTINMAN